MYYNRICSSEGIYIAKSDNSGTFKIYRYWFFDHEFKVKDSVCDGSHVLTCCILIYSMLLLSLLKLLIIMALFITLANLKQLIYQKSLYLMIMDICKINTKKINIKNPLYVLIMWRKRFRVNLHSIVVWMSRTSLLKKCAISSV